MTVSFFDSVHYDHRRPLSWSETLLETADSYFALPWTRKFRVLPVSTRGNAQAVVEENYPLSKLNITLKIASLFTLFLVPLIMLLAKAATRRNHHFYLIDPNEPATKIQSHFKRLLAKRTLNRLKVEKHIQRKAARSIQKVYSQFVKRKRELARREKTAIFIQKNYRKHTAQLAFSKLREERDRKYYSELCLVTSSPVSCGPKHDNLFAVRKTLPEELASVPAFFGFTDAQIKACLSPETQHLWQQAKESSNRQGALENALTTLQESVRKDILSAKFINPEQRQAVRALKGKGLIVRSSSNEDGRVVNAGGNKTLGNIPATETDLKKAIADVVSSYFGYKSLKNRSDFEDAFASMPLCSVLVMEQIIDRESQSPVISGVMMTHKPNWGSSKEGRMMQISATFGFGEGVVSGRIPSDEWIITDSRTYETVRKKSHRLRVLPGGVSRETLNDPFFQEKPVLEKDMLEKLGAVAKQLEGTFGCHLDIEFVIDNKKLYIVQARPVQAPVMKKTTYLDPETLPEKCERFLTAPILAGTGQVLSIKGEKILFASTLEEANTRFRRTQHDTVIIHTPPQASNSHAAVNFSSYRPPISCFALPQAQWEECHTRAKQNPRIYLCSQTGTVLVTEQEVKLREGLFAHPVSSPLSIGSHSRSVQSVAADSDILEVEKLLSATPENLVKHLDEIQAKITSIFDKILGHKTQTKKIREIAIAMQASVQRTIEVMQKCQLEKASHLSMHAKMLKQMLHQVNSAIVSAHSLAGIKTAMQLPPTIEAFIKEHHSNEILVELATLGNKAFDEALQKKWISFLNKHLESPKLKELYDILQEIDSINMLPLWFSFYLAEDLPNVDSCIKETNSKFLRSCSDFDLRFQNMMSRTERIDSVEDLHRTWETLLDLSHTFVKFASKSQDQNSFQRLYLNRVFINLINLWDLNIKTVRTSQLLFFTETTDLFHNRVTQFAKFGMQCLDSSLIDGNLGLSELMNEMQYPARKGERSFPGVEHWIVPRSERCGCIENDDQRLSVIHQNLLQAAQLNLSPSLLPSRLATAVNIFHKHNDPMLVKRYASSKGTFLSISEGCASVKINVPLNFHSFVITLCQNRQSSPLEVTAYWRGSDNYQGNHEDFLQVFCMLTGITLKSSRVQNSDLEVVFAINSEEQMILLSRAIYSVNCMSLHSKNYFGNLVYLLNPGEISDNDETYDKETWETQHKIWDVIWQWFTVKKNMPYVLPDFALEKPSKVLVNFFITRNLISEIQAHVISELEGNADGPFIKNYFLNLLARAVSKEEEILKIKKAMWDNITQRKKLSLLGIPKIWSKELYQRLCKEAPKAALFYCKDRDYIIKYLKPFIEEMAKEGSASPEAQELIDFVLKPSKK